MLPNEAYAVKCDGNDKLCVPHSFERLATREQNRLQAKDKGNHSVRALCRWPTGHGPPTQHTAVQLVICLPNKAREGGPGRSRRSEDDQVLQVMHTYWRNINLLGVQSFHMTMTRSPSHFHTSSAVSIEDFQCPVCFNVLDCPVQVSRQALLCANCLVGHLCGRQSYAMPMLQRGSRHLT